MHEQIRIGLPKVHGRFLIGLPKVHGRFRIGPFQAFHPICLHYIFTVGEFRCTIAIMQETHQNVLLEIEWLFSNQVSGPCCENHDWWFRARVLNCQRSLYNNYLYFVLLLNKLSFKGCWKLDSQGFVENKLFNGTSIWGLRFSLRDISFQNLVKYCLDVSFWDS